MKTIYDTIADMSDKDLALARAVREDAMEDAAQAVRYYLKHQNFEGDRSPYEEGVEATCENLVDALLEKAAESAGWKPR